jgi:DNA repair exonuclease SbcCD ATPase subunit
MKKDLKQIFKVRGEEIEVFLVPDETKARYGEPYPELEKKKSELTHEQYTKDAKELRHETLRERLKHHEDAVSNIKGEMAALEKDMKEDKSDIAVESKGASEKQKAAKEKFLEMIRKKKGGDKKDGDKEEKDDDKKSKKKEASKAGWEKTDEKELKRDTKKEKVEHEKDAIEDDESKIKKLKKGKPSEKKSAEKKALKKDVQYDKKSKKSYAEMLRDIAAERFGGKKRSKLKDSDFLDPKRRSFPVMSAQDVKDAVSSWGRYKGSMSFDEFKAKLTRRAKKIGAESALPKSWTEKK